MASSAAKDYEREDLKRDLKSRHIQMIAIGGAIGTGLFYGSGWAVETAGPAIIVTYAVASVAIYFIMRALGEMSVEEPVSGAYISYANRYIRRFAGFLNGWNAFIFLLAATAAELNALGRYVQYWLPGVPIWVTAAVAVTGPEADAPSRSRPRTCRCRSTHEAARADARNRWPPSRGGHLAVVSASGRC
ncbi:amino acid permease [Streptomyces sp. NPDC050803]|uniref:amino acid permease n=1 Tax=unclassified Streptomyces TaxID=2593676 RepID=UPI003448C200